MKYKIVSELLSLISISVTQANVKIWDFNLSYRIYRLLILSLGFYSLCFLSQRSCDANNEPLDHQTSKNLTQKETGGSGFTFSSEKIFSQKVPEYKLTDFQLAIWDLYKYFSQVNYSYSPLQNQPIKFSFSRTAPPKFSPCTQVELTSVRIFQKKDEWGSGVIFQKVESGKKSNVYYVFTNEHVVRGYKKINVIYLQKIWLCRKLKS